MSRITTADFHKGMFITFKNEPHQIVEFQHVNPGKGSAFVRSRLKSFKTGRVQEITFKAGEEVEDLSINPREMQYLYKEGDNFVFMDNKSYEQMSVSKTVLGEYANYLKENETYQLLVFEDQAIGVRFPKKVRLTVVETEDAVKGNTVSGATKPAKLETGVSVQVPLFIKTGDVIGIDPETGEYVDRVTG